MYFRLFDCWRFVAAILIMAYHFLFAAPYGAEVGTEFLRRLLPLLDMFFMISGFFITTRYGSELRGLSDYRGFLRRRIARLYPLHVIVTLFFVAVAVAAMLAGADNYPWARELEAVPLHLLAVHALGTTDHLALNYVSWSVSAEFFCYAAFPLIILATRWKGLPGLCLFTACWLAGLELASRWGVFPSGHWTSADTMGAYRAFADFCIGACIAGVVARRSLDIRSHLPGLALLAAAVGAMIGQMPTYLVLVLLAASLTATALAETARPHSTAALRFAMPVTRVSFGIYLWHPVMEFLFLTVLWTRWIEPTGMIDFYVFWLLPMAATLAVAILSDRYLEKRFGALIAGPRPRPAGEAQLASA
ncbi:acyltransferase family protein [Aurantimonas endophytica]|uniref:Peptidoglycan/LPS O-acetylase OafA/YrhL n=1 Tax=Aurantimonas endophytica TaxID=1522175 RepID=A0A7W6HHA5_9HYPH|nr:peptidoglycan/LPS O-acetylase OafA/YrhL [Aurantimonas endophytica]